MMKYIGEAKDLSKVSLPRLPPPPSPSSSSLPLTTTCRSTTTSFSSSTRLPPTCSSCSLPSRGARRPQPSRSPRPRPTSPRQARSPPAAPSLGLEHGDKDEEAEQEDDHHPHDDLLLWEGGLPEPPSLGELPEKYWERTGAPPTLSSAGPGSARGTTGHHLALPRQEKSSLQHWESSITSTCDGKWSAKPWGGVDPCHVIKNKHDS